MMKNRLQAVRQRLTLALALAVAVPMLLVTAPASSAVSALEPSPVAAYDNLEDPPASSYPSLGFQATSTNEIGDLVHLEPGQRILDSITVQMVNWACQTGGGTSCVTNPGSFYLHPLTLKLYSVTGPDAAPVLGTELYSQTWNHEIPFRPSADAVNCSGGTWYSPEGVCMNGYAFQVTFDTANDAAAPPVLPQRVVWTVSYNTNTKGYAPINTPGWYDSLNVGVSDTTVVAGSNADPDSLWISSTYPDDTYTCGAPHDGTLVRAPGCRTGLQPMAKIVTSDSGLATTDTIVRPHVRSGWEYARENGSPLGLIAPVIEDSSIALGQVGDGAAHVVTANSAEGKTWFTPQFDGTPLADITQLSYSVLTDTLNYAPALGFDIQYRTGDSAYSGRLVYEPIYNGGLAVGEWTTFDTVDGVWWASKQNAAGSNGNCLPSGPMCTWDDVLALFPDASIGNPDASTGVPPSGYPGNLTVKLGSGGPSGYDTFFDNVTIGINQADGSVNQTTFDFESGCTTDCYVSTTGDDANSGATPGDPLRNIQTGVNAVDAGGTVHVAAGTYLEDVIVNKSADIIGADATTTIVEGPIGGSGGAAFDVVAADVLIEGFTITRAGNNTTDWTNPALNTWGVLVQADDVEITGNIITGNRTGVDFRGAVHTGVTVHNNEIIANRTGVIFFNGAPDLMFTENSVTGNHTVGVLFIPDPAAAFDNAVFTNNDFSGNWYGGVVNRYDPGAGANFPLDFGGNYFGPGELTITTADSSEPGYSTMIPIAYGGTATAPAAPHPYLAGVGSVNVDVTPYLDTPTDTDVGTGLDTFGFQGDFSSLTVSDNSFQIGAIERIQEGVNRVTPGGTVHLEPGIYIEHTAVKLNKAVSLLGPNAGVSPNDAANPVNANAARLPEATIYAAGTNRSLDVNAADVTVDGIRFIDNAAASSAGTQVPLIGGGPAFGGAAPDATIVNNIFDSPSRLAVFFNSPTFHSGLIVDDNRVNTPTSLTGCAGTCSRTLFNLWKTDDVSFSGNTVVAAPGNTHRTRVLNVNSKGGAITSLDIRDNTIRYACNAYCISLAAGAEQAEITGNDILIDAGHAISFYYSSSNTANAWTEGSIDIHHNRLTDTGNAAITFGNPSADYSGVAIYRNTIDQGGFRNDSTFAVSGECNYWGQGSGPLGAQVVGPATTSPFLPTSDLDGACGTPVDVVAVAGDAEVSVSWSPSSVPLGTEALTGYTVVASPGGASCTTPGATTCAVTGLTNGQAYTFTATATYGSTDTAPSAPSNSATPTGVPDPVQNAATVENPSIQITWDAPAFDGGSAITGYTVTVSPGTATCNTAASVRECSFGGLTAGTEYTFSIVAKNVNGDSTPVTVTGTPPGAPEAPVATTTATTESVTVAWTAPNSFGSPITGYTVTTAPGGATCTTTGLTCTFSELNPDVTHTFSVVATSAGGTSAPGTATAMLIPVEIAGPNVIPDYNPVGPLRLLDTRGDSSPVLVTVPVAQIGPNDVLEVQVTGHPDAVPSTGAGAVSLNVTATNTSAAGFIRVFPCGDQSATSSVNFTGADQSVANAVITPMSDTGTVCFFSLVPTDLVVDVNGWFRDDLRAFTPVSPQRVFDTRGDSDSSLISVPTAKVAAGTTLRVSIAGMADGVVPATGAAGVSLNVTATNTAGPGFITVYPCGDRSKVSNVNFTGANKTVANAVITPLSADGELCFFSLVDADLVVDINGWLSHGSKFELVEPVRVFDTRGESATALVTVPVDTVGGDHELRVKITDLGDSVPATGVNAVSLNVTATNTAGPGFITVYPCGERGTISSLNFGGSNQTVANAVIAPVSADGEICFFARVDTDIVVDLNGWSSSVPYNAP